jgi:hypothetical protein
MSDPDLTPDERLRQMLSEAVEPVQPGPGAEARLHAKIRARRRTRDLQRQLRWAGVVLGAAAVVTGGILVLGPHSGRGSDGSSASSALAAGASSTSAAQPSAAAAGPSGPPASPNSAKQAAPAVPVPAQSSAATAGLPPGSASSRTGSDLSGGTTRPVPSLEAGIAGSQAYQPTPASDLDGDHVADQLTLSGQKLVVNFRHGRQTVTLPQVGAGARVLGVTLLQKETGGLTPVAIVRLRVDAVHAYDTLVALVPAGTAGKLTVLRLDGKPVVLTVSGSQGYACAGPLLLTTGTAKAYVVESANLVADGPGGVARPGSNCGFR